MQTEVNASKTDSGLIFTESAAKKVKTLIEDEKNPNLKLRVFITGGGCSAFNMDSLLMKRYRTVILRLKNVV